MDIFQVPETPIILQLQTRNRTNIQNEQRRLLDLSTQEFKQNSINKMKQCFGNLDAIFLKEPTPIYNCHGMTFASRRTAIYEQEDLKNILKEEYTKIEKGNTSIGDIVIYKDSNNEITHSATIIEIRKDAMIHIKVWGKAGNYKEVVHYYNNVPSAYGNNIEFHTLKHESTNI